MKKEIEDIIQGTDIRLSFLLGVKEATSEDSEVNIIESLEHRILDIETIRDTLVKLKNSEHRREISPAQFEMYISDSQ